MPAAPADVRFTGSVSFTCDAAAQASAYHVYRGTRAVTAPFAYNQPCFLTSLVGPSFSDGDPLEVGQSFYYLVNSSTGCGQSDLGSASRGSPCPNPVPCP